MSVMNDYPTTNQDTSLLHKRDLPYELLWQRVQLPNQAPGRVLAFSPMYESEVVVGEIAGRTKALAQQPPRSRIWRRGGRIVGYLVNCEAASGGGYNCTYEIYKRYQSMAAAPLRRQMLESGCDLVDLRSRVERRCNLPQLPMESMAVNAVEG
jgi:hypothetical protein